MATLKPEEKLALLKTMPSEYHQGWRGCKFEDCHNWFNEKTQMQRHVQLVHPGAKMTQAFDNPFICGFKFERANGALGVPEGPSRYCFDSFKTEKELAAHKSTLKHIRPPKKKDGKKKGQKTAARDDADVEIVEEEDDNSDDSENDEDDEFDSGDNDDQSEGDPMELDGSDEESEVAPPAPPVPTRRAPSTLLRDTFLGLLGEARNRVESGRITVEEGVRTIIQYLAGKAFVRSNNEEDHARKIGREIKAAKTKEEKLALLIGLCDRLRGLEF
jgi:hypothetical protein